MTDRNGLQPAETGGSIRILHVDDNRLDRGLVRDALEQAETRFEVVEAATQDEFENQLADFDFDLVLSDFNILGFEGFDVLDAVHHRSPDTPIVIVTGTGSEEVAVEAMRRGAADYVIKTPRHIRRLPFTLATILEQARLRALARKAQRELLQAKEQSERIIAQNADGMLVVDEQGDVLFANRAVAELMGRSGETLVGSTIGIPTVGEGPAEMAIRREDGESRWIELRATSIDWHGQNAMLVSMRDVTRRKQTEDRLAEREKLLSMITNNMHDMVAVANDQGCLTYVSPSHKQLGYEAEDLLGTPLVEFIHEDDLERVQTRLAELISTREPVTVDFRYRCADGSYRWLESIGQMLSDDAVGDATLIVSTRDIERIKDQQARLIAEKKRAQSYLDVAAVMLLGLDEHCRITMLNQEGCGILGVDSQEAVLGADWLEFIPEDDRDQVLSVLESLINGRGDSFDEVEARIRRSTGEERRLVWRNRLVHDEEGQVVGTLSSGDDVTDRRAVEAALSDSEAMLRQAQRLEAIGRLAGGVAHDFNNILTVINTHSELAEHLVKKGHPALWDIQQIREAGERAAALTGQLLAFSRKQRQQSRVLDLNEIINKLQTMLRRLIGENVELRLDLGANPGMINADPSQIEQILMNLTVNARDAMPNGGVLSIGTTDVDLDHSTSESYPGLRPGAFVMLSVSDTGIGMDAATQGEIFEPFFTTKEEGKGTGLGLATVFGIVKQHNGAISVYSEVGHGTTFKVFLPRVHAPEGEGEAHPPTVREYGGGEERVLVVEDDVTLRRVITRVLRTAGYTVAEAADGNQAIKEFARASSGIDLVLTDVIMPQMSGRELAGRLSEGEAGPKVIYMSGYTAGAVTHSGVESEGLYFIAKPFAIPDLLEKVREVLDAD